MSQDLQKKLLHAKRLRLFLTRMLGKRRLRNNYYYSVALFVQLGL